MSKTYNGNDKIDNFFAHYGRKGMKRGMNIFNPDYNPIGKKAESRGYHSHIGQTPEGYDHTHDTKIRGEYGGKAMSRATPVSKQLSTIQKSIAINKAFDKNVVEPLASHHRQNSFGFNRNDSKYMESYAARRRDGLRRAMEENVEELEKQYLQNDEDARRKREAAWAKEDAHKRDLEDEKRQQEERDRLHEQYAKEYDAAERYRAQQNATEQDIAYKKAAKDYAEWLEEQEAEERRAKLLAGERSRQSFKNKTTKDTKINGEAAAKQRIAEREAELRAEKERKRRELVLEAERRRKSNYRG